MQQSDGWLLPALTVSYDFRITHFDGTEQCDRYERHCTMPLNCSCVVSAKPRSVSAQKR